VNRSRYEWDEGNYEDEEKEMGALCFTQRVRRTLVPKGFKLPHDQQKYDGSQEPELWLSDYLQAVKILGGSKTTTMKKLAATPHQRSTVLVKQVTRRFHRKLGRARKSIHNNFHSTYMRPASIEEVKSCTQKNGKALRSYIQRWSIIKTQQKTSPMSEQ
jgi:hypothetical protein